MSHGKLFLRVVAVTLALAPTLSGAQGTRGAAEARTYELRIYTATAGRLADLQAVFRAAGATVLARNRIENVFDGTVAEPARIDGADGPNMLVCIFGYASRAEAERAGAAFESDPEWKAAWGKAEQGGALLAKPVEVVLMTPTEFSPALEPPSAAGAPQRIFELRRYNTGPQGTPWTVSQFKDGLAAIIAKQGMMPVAYWTAADSSAFIYLLAHKDREAARVSWSTFLADYRPYMTEFNAKQAAAGIAPPPTGTRRPDDNRFLTPTDFSPRR